MKRVKSPAGAVMIGVLHLYRVTLSPVFFAFGVRCRHEPSCSAYAADAVRAQGAWRGLWLAFGRISRCRPGGTHGYDPAPPVPTDAPWWALARFRESPAVIQPVEPADRAGMKDEAS